MSVNATSTGFRDATAIAGVGNTEYSKNSGVTTMTLALRAIKAALDDAGLSIKDVDGVACHRIGDSVSPTAVAQALGVKDLRFISDLCGGGSTSTSVIANAAMAVATGMAECVVCWRSLNARSGLRMGGTGVLASGESQFLMPLGHLAAPQNFAMYCRAYKEARGYADETFGHVAISQRENARTSPRAMMTKPLTMEDYLASNWIVEPLRLFDCCLETDAAVALVITSTAKARDLAKPVVSITAAAFGGGDTSLSNGKSDMTTLGIHSMAPRLYAAAGLGPGDIDIAELYDAFTPLVLMQLEGYGLCTAEEIPEFLAAGETRIGGRLPVNTHGGHLSEGYVHGLNHVVEAVRQLRGERGEGQVAKAEVALSTSQPGLSSGLTGALILKRA